jgi:hypothetical protein
MFELTKGADVIGLQSLSESVVTEEVAQLHRRARRVRVRSNTCLITLNNSANGISILNILNGFGG